MSAIKSVANSFTMIRQSNDEFTNSYHHGKLDVRPFTNCLNLGRGGGILLARVRGDGYGGVLQAKQAGNIQIKV